MLKDFFTQVHDGNRQSNSIFINMNVQLNRFCVGRCNEVTISITITRTFERGVKMLAERASVT